MIGFLKGKIINVQNDHVIVDVQGVGYEVFCHQRDILEINSSGLLFATDLTSDFNSNSRSGKSNNPNEASTEFWIYTQVREDSLTLFGFLDSEEKQFFLTLLKVNGIGPKMAMNMLSGADAQKISQMIESEDVKGLSGLPKVGKKSAEQMILTLKGKLNLKHRDETKKVTSGVHKEISTALTHLGFRSVEIERVVSSLPKDIKLEDGIKSSLSKLTTL